MEFFDSHSHYNDEAFDKDRGHIIEEAYSAGITKILCAGYNIEKTKKAIELAGIYPYIYASAGISPNDLSGISEEQIRENISEIKELAKNESVVAIGEIGLDYYWNKENKELQKELFISQIELANDLNLPIIIHTREAWQDTIKILKTYVGADAVRPLTGVFHCCPLNQELVKEVLGLDFYISFAGPITYKNTKNAAEIIGIVPIEKIVLETDCPYLSPEPKRGTRNDSRNIEIIAKKVAEIKKMKIEDIAKITYENTKRLFNI